MRSLIAFVEGNAGGGEPVAAPAPTGVIDEYQLAVIPAVPGRRGKPLFGGLGRGMELRLTGSRRLQAGPSACVRPRRRGNCADAGVFAGAGGRGWPVWDC